MQRRKFVQKRYERRARIESPTDGIKIQSGVLPALLRPSQHYFCFLDSFGQFTLLEHRYRQSTQENGRG